MKQFILLILFLFTVNIFASENEEFRATWVITWNHSSSSDDVEASKARIRKILDNHKKANMNAVLWQVRQSGTAYYNSSFEPWGPYSNGPYADDYDILEYAIEQAHQRGMEIHAWFNTFHASSIETGAPAAEHPEWVCRNSDGTAMTESRALSPGMDAVRDYTIDVAMEIVNNYDIDGLHLDYVRWNEEQSNDKLGKTNKLTEKEKELDGFITEEQIESLSKTASGRYLYDVDHPYSAGIPSGFSSWEEWWRWSVTEFVKTLHDSIQSVKPWVRLSAAALGKYNWSTWQGYGSVYQDAALWFNEGYIDQLTPMHYHWTTGDGFYGMLTGDLDQSWGYYIKKGINAGRLFSVGPGSYILDEQNKWNNHKPIVEKSRTVDWVDGFQFFSYGNWYAYVYWEEAAELFYKNKTKIRAANFLSSDIPDSPTISMTKKDSLEYEISVDPPATIAKNQWFALYRSEDDSLDVNNDEIIEIKFGTESFSVVDSFNGNQDFNGQYNYFATTLSRFWLESEPSNSEITDEIPSFAPVVNATFPQQGDSLSLYEDVIIYFSKTMNTESFETYVSIDNEVQIESLNWQDNNKTLIISFVGSLVFDTEYQLTISEDAEDVNGVKLDGNGDGGTSEPFVFIFHTYSEDNRSPEVSFSNLNFPDTTKSVDPKGVLTLGFNELLENETVTDENIKIFRNNNEVAAHALINTYEDQSVVSVQTEEALESYVTYKLVVGDAVSDTAGNILGNNLEYLFKTEPYRYSEEVLIDEMYSDVSNWWDPEGSGSTTGTVGGNTTFTYTNKFYLPMIKLPYKKYSAQLQYEWEEGAGSYLLREYCAGAPKNITFDTTYTLQVYVYGDGSNNQFRFSLSEKEGEGYALEVSKWITIDWIGWQLVEWKLSDPSTVGTWLGNEILDGKAYAIDSYQLTHPADAEMTGKIYFSNLRAIKKEHYITGIERDNSILNEFALMQNYPNPFNPVTNIKFSIEQTGKTQLSVYNMLGQKVTVLINNVLSPGQYNVIFNGASLASGTYIYELKNNSKVVRKKMVLVK